MYLTIDGLSTHPTSAAYWLKKGSVMCYHVWLMMHVKDPKLYAVRVGYCVLCPCSLHVLNREINISQQKISSFFITSPFFKEKNVQKDEILKISLSFSSATF